MYQALYRKWRPGTFDDVVGQQHVTETLKRQIMSNRLSHAYLFVGTRGTGKTTCAKLLAKTVNCEHPINGNPCNKCPSCVGINNGSILDVEEMDAASNNRVDDIRAIREEAVFTPANVKKRVYIVDEVHMLSTAAFNALLKILEEPPEHLIFILATTELNKVPATILSRCQRFTFKRITPEDIANRLMYVAGQENIDLKEDAAELLARLSDGALRDALSLLDQCASGGPVDVECVNSVVGLAGAEKTAELARAVFNGDFDASLGIVDELYRNGKEISSILNELMALLRDILIVKAAPNMGAGLMSGNYSKKTVSDLAAGITGQRVLSSLRELESSLGDIAVSSNRRTVGEMCVVRLCSPEFSNDISALNARVAELEKIIQNGTPVIKEPAAVKKAAAADKIPEAPAPVTDNDGPGEHGGRPPWETTEPPPEERQEFPPQTPEPAEAPEIKEPPEPAEAAAPGADIGGADAWAGILKVLEPNVDSGVYTSFLSNSAQIACEISGGSLTVLADNAFAAMMVDQPQITNEIKTAAEKVLGHPVIVKVREGKASDELKADKLDALKKFGNIKFE